MDATILTSRRRGIRVAIIPTHAGMAVADEIALNVSSAEMEIRIYFDRDEEKDVLAFLEEWGFDVDVRREGS